MSSWLFNLKAGDPVTVSGPFGEFFARETDKEMCFVAAGAGPSGQSGQSTSCAVSGFVTHSAKPSGLCRRSIQA